MTTTDGGLLSGITDWAIGLMEGMGGPGAAIAIALENLFPPIPSEVILPLAGLAAGQGRLNLFAAIAWTTTGSLAGALLLYCLGALLGRDRLVAIADRMPLVKVSDIERTEAWFARHGGRAVFLGRFVPLFRSFISIPAGLERMPVIRFLLYTGLGSLVWNTVFILIGYQLGERYKVIAAWMDAYSKVILGLVIAAVLVFVVVRVRSARRERRDRADGDGPGAAPEDRSAPGGAVPHGDGHYRSRNRRD